MMLAYAWVIPAILAVIAAAGAATGAYVQIQQGRAAKRAGDFNAELAAQNAKQAAESAAFDARQLRRQRMLLSGRQRAAAAASGIQLSGSFEDVYTDSAVQGELQAASRLYEGMAAERNYRAQGMLEKWSGKQAMKAAKGQAAATLLAGLGEAGMAGYTAYKAKGVNTAKPASVDYSSAIYRSAAGVAQSDPSFGGRPTPRGYGAYSGR